MALGTVTAVHEDTAGARCSRQAPGLVAPTTKVNLASLALVAGSAVLIWVDQFRSGYSDLGYNQSGPM
jgi:hypothetical protein